LHFAFLHFDMNTENLKFDKRRNRVTTCPCGKRNKDGKFAPFQGYDIYGHCFSCGETFFPPEENAKVQKCNPPEVKTSFTDSSVLKKSLNGYDHNGFTVFLADRFGDDVAALVIGRYFIGTTRNGGTVFWQIDIDGNIRGGKVIEYNSQTGKRKKDVHPTWAHSLLHNKDYSLQQCLFGEHLLKKTRKPVGIVESEKTAVIASIYFPDMIWMACGGKDGLKPKKMQILKNRKVILFPDVDGYDLWCNKAAELSPMLDVIVSDLIERKATEDERKGKFDLADYLLRFNPDDFIQKKSSPEYALDGTLIDPVKGYPVSWDIPKVELSPLEKMIKKNPAVQLLIDRFKLIEVKN
jgi:hypothetical protein